MYKRILVTGGAGFVGSNLATLLKQDYPDAEVISLDNLKRRGSELSINRLKAAGVEFVHGDIRNPEDLEQTGDVDLLVECSAEPSVLAGYDSSPAYLLNTNLVGTLNCMELARKTSADVVFLSTSRVYPMRPLGQLAFTEQDTRFAFDPAQSLTGVSAQGVSEQFPLTGARTLYGTTKLASELVIGEYVEMYNLRAVINRCAVLTGPWQMGKVDQGVTVLWVARHFFGGNLSYLGYGGTGKQVRDILHVADLYDLLRLQLRNMDAHSGEVYNVGGGPETSVSLQELTRLCEQATGNKISIASVPENRQGDIPWYVTDNAKVTAATGWTPRHTPEQIVDQIAHWLHDNESTLKHIL